MSLVEPAPKPSSYLEASLDKLGDHVRRDDVIEVCINPDGRIWIEVQGDHFMRPLDARLSSTEMRDMGDRIASAANARIGKQKPIVSVSIAYRGRPVRAQVIRSHRREPGRVDLAALLLVASPRPDRAEVPLRRRAQP